MMYDHYNDSSNSCSSHSSSNDNDHIHVGGNSITAIIRTIKFKRMIVVMVMYHSRMLSLDKPGPDSEKPPVEELCVYSVSDLDTVSPTTDTGSVADSVSVPGENMFVDCRVLDITSVYGF